MHHEIRAMVLAEDVIAEYQDANNGSDPFWCFGSRTIARDGDTVYAAVPEVGPDVKPLCNTRWRLFARRDGDACTLVHRGEVNEREPCPLACLPGHRLLLSTNPAVRVNGTLPDGRLAHACDPQLLIFDLRDMAKPPTVIKPVWDREYAFFEHSYRGLGVDHESGHVLQTHQVAVDHEYNHAWSFLDGDLKPVRQGLLRFPMRGCYQQVALRGTAAYVMAVSDEYEPNQEWREFKDLAASGWDYDFRQLFFTWTPDITKQDFSPPLTVASRDETAGHIRNLDMLVDAGGDAHLLFIQRTIWWPALRDRFFPGLPISVSLNYARIHVGRVVARKTIIEATEIMDAPHVHAEKPWVLPVLPMKGPVPNDFGAVLHEMPDQRLLAVWHQTDGDESGMFIRELESDSSRPSRVPWAHPFDRFVSACKRAGTDPSRRVDLYGRNGPEKIVRYAQIEID
jgi:hypothetical protein